MKRKTLKPKVSEPYTFEQMVDGEGAFIHPSGEHMYQVCCDCGSAHSIKLVVLNAEEIEVTFFKHKALTKAARAEKDNTNGILVSPDVYKALIDLSKVLSTWPGTKQVPKKLRQEMQVLGKALLSKQNEFEAIVKSGDFLS